jgi:intracellular sulfur oxidation DsrE/DsrF family protein
MKALHISISSLILAVMLVASSIPATAQHTEMSSGATASLEEYKAVYILNSGEEKKITGTLRNIRNALEDPRLKGKLKIELVVFGDGVKVYDKTGPFGGALKELHKSGVILAQCENTLRERKISKASLYPFLTYVPSGNGEVIIRHHEGWAIIHP